MYRHFYIFIGINGDGYSALVVLETELRIYFFLPFVVIVLDDKYH
jgi:hypothetical protein